MGDGATVVSKVMLSMSKTLYFSNWAIKLLNTTCSRILQVSCLWDLLLNLNSKVLWNISLLLFFLFCYWWVKLFIVVHVFASKFFKLFFTFEFKLIEDFFLNLKLSWSLEMLVYFIHNIIIGFSVLSYILQKLFFFADWISWWWEVCIVGWFAEFS